MDTPTAKDATSTTNAAEFMALTAVVGPPLVKAPLPWRVERGWSFEVIASNGAVVAKCPTREEADAIIALASAQPGKA